MTNILNQVAKSHHSRFQPSNSDEYFALRLARGLGEPEAAAHYAVLASQRSESTLLSAYRAALGAQHEQPARVFHEYLTARKEQDNDRLPQPRLMAIRIERRVVAMALFAGTHLEGWRVRQLSSDPKLAESTATGFIRDVLDEHKCPGMAVEAVPGDVVRADLHRAVVQECRAMGIAVWEVSKKSVIDALAHPAPKSRDEVRKLMLGIWPLPRLKQAQMCALDAFALGLYVQTERIFAADSQG